MSKVKFYLVTDRNGDLLRLTPEALARWVAMGKPALRDYGNPTSQESGQNEPEKQG